MLSLSPPIHPQAGFRTLQGFCALKDKDPGELAGTDRLKASSRRTLRINLSLLSLNEILFNDELSIRGR
jgi:hypothetical protein